MNSVRFLLLPLLLLFAVSSSAQITTANLLTSTTNKLVRPTEFGTNLIAQPDAASARTLLGVSAGSSFTNANFVGGTVTGMTNSDLTASRVMVSGATGIPTNGSVTSATLLFLDATSSIQTQLNAKAAMTTLAGYVTNLGGLATNLTVDGLTVTIGQTNSHLTASRVVVTDANKGLVSSATTATEIGYVSGVTSALQTQLDAKAPLASPTFTGTITGNGAGLTNLSAGSLLNLYAEGARVGTAPAATNLNSVAIGMDSSTSTASNAVALGGSTASGSSSFSAGQLATASGVFAVAIGYATEATTDYAVAIGRVTKANAIASIATGESSKATLYGQHAHSSGSLGASGSSQTSVLVAAGVSTSGSATNIYLGGSSSFPMTLANNTTWSFHVRVIARRTDATGENMDWTFDGIIKRDANAASTALVGDVVVSPRTGVTTAWDCTVTANATDGSLQINVTGEAAKTIRWVARIETVEVSN